MKQWTDKQLFDSLRKNNKEALSILFLRHHSHLCHYGLRITSDTQLVEGCIQELFVYLFESFDRCSEVCHVRAYLYKSLRRRILEKICQKKRLEKWDAISYYRSNLHFSTEDMEWNRQQDAQARSALVEALNTLPWRQREAVYLRYYNRLSTKQIAEIMGVANQTVLNTLYQALKNLRKHNKLKHLIGYLLPWSLILFW